MKEVEVFGIIMANKFQSSKMRQPFAIMIVICILIQLELELVRLRLRTLMKNGTKKLLSLVAELF